MREENCCGLSGTISSGQYEARLFVFSRGDREDSGKEQGPATLCGLICGQNFEERLSRRAPEWGFPLSPPVTLHPSWSPPCAGLGRCHCPLGTVYVAVSGAVALWSQEWEGCHHVSSRGRWSKRKEMIFAVWRKPRVWISGTWVHRLHAW